MTDEHEHDHDHDEHDHDHDEHEHHHHAYDWQAELLADARRGRRTTTSTSSTGAATSRRPASTVRATSRPIPTGASSPASIDTVAGAGDHAEIATSTGQVRHMHVAGDLVFEADGAEHRLTAFVSERDGYEVLFVPFRDATSGTRRTAPGATSRRRSTPSRRRSGRARLQLRLQPVVRLQPGLRLPVSAAPRTGCQSRPCRRAPALRRGALATQQLSSAVL